MCSARAYLEESGPIESSSVLPAFFWHAGAAFRLRHFHPLRPDFAPGASNAFYQVVNGADVGSLGWISKSDRRAGLAQRAQRQALYILYLYYNIQNTT